MAKSKREYFVLYNSVVFLDSIESITEENGFVYVNTVGGHKHPARRDITTNDILVAMGNPVRKG